MNQEHRYPMRGAGRYLAACFAVLCCLPGGGLLCAQGAAAAVKTDETEQNVTTLSPFEVSTEKDYGYLKTNAATATRIGMEIQKVPLNISVVSREFLDDTNARSLTDLFRYSAAASGDNRFAMRRPANEASPQGAFTMRGFQVNSLMRNGLLRYTAYNLDNVERVEVVKGPASVFFGQGYPGGVINYITKQPSFTNIPATISMQWNDNSGQKVKLDQNTVLSKKAAMRIVGAWEDTQGEYREEFRKNFNITPSLTLVPFESGKLRINLDMEYLKERYNQTDNAWIYSDFAGWKNAALTGQYGSSTATLSNTVAGVVQSTTTPTLSYTQYIQNKRVATGDLNLPAYTRVERGGYYTNAAGQYIHDEAMNGSSRGTASTNEVEVFTAIIDFSPFEWLDGRYGYVNDHSTWDSVGTDGQLQPYADGIHFSSNGLGTNNYYRSQQTHNVDLVFKADLFAVKNKLMVGYQRSTWTQQYLSQSNLTDVNWAFLPGARNTVSNPDYAVNPGLYVAGNVPVNQVIYQRDGTIKPVRQIYSNYDPGFEINPDVTVHQQGSRNALDGYKPKLEGQYVNYQGSMLDDRLTVLVGYRKEKRWERGQWQVNNFPWYTYTDNMFLDPVRYPENQYGHSINYQKTVPKDQSGDSWMGGASFAVNKSVTVYASLSKIFKFNEGIVGGQFPGDEQKIAQGIIDEYAARGNPGGFVYRGQSITSIGQFNSLIDGVGYNQRIPNEEGKNYEAGVKYTSADSKIVGTLSLFSANRINRREDDFIAQSNINEPLNYNTNPIWIAGAARSGLIAATAANTGRVFRVRSYGNKVEIKGAEAEVIWTPIRNFQALINGSWMPTAETVADSRPVYSKPGSDYYNNVLTAAQKRDADILWKARVENVPEYRFNIFGKYTFLDGPARGLSLGGGLRYSSETVVSRSVDWNPLAGGYQAGDYMVFDVTASYPWELLGYKMQTSLGIYNVTDEVYSEGTYVMSPARNWLITHTLRF